MAKSPVVSIITATYNRSDVLKLAISSVLRSTFQDWELLVIADACTDDTGQVVESFQDSRIIFHNLPFNVGEQSGPNNEGVRRARGRYLAFLNHDDLWLPNHLSVGLERLRNGNADLVFAMAIRFEPNNRRLLIGASPSGHYHPNFGVPASCWLFRRALAKRVGPWKFYQESYAVPSQDWLFRTYRAGARLEQTGRVTVLVFPSYLQPKSYQGRKDHWQQKYFTAMCEDDDFLEKELTLLAEHMEVERRWGVGRLLRAAARNSILRLSSSIGWHPAAVTSLLLGMRKGQRIDKLRELRGLARLQRKGKRRVG